MFQIVSDVEIKLNLKEKIKIFLVGNKNDLASKREVTNEEGSNFAEKKQVLFFETSAKEGKGVGALFENILDKLNEPPVLLNQNVSESSNEIVSKKANLQKRLWIDNVIVAIYGNIIQKKNLLLLLKTN